MSTGKDGGALGLSMEIQLEARNLPNMDFGSLSDPFAVISIREGSEWREFGTFTFKCVDGDRSNVLCSQVIVTR